ncbi:NAD(P)-dependent oxidoreductase [Amylibacter sp.]|nr:NAD(P)-dependent oxidoreductase [Amylibacter sp.]
MIKILNVEPLGYSKKAIKTWKQYGFSYEETSWDQIESRETFDEVNILIIRLGKKIDAKILNRFPNLNKVISATTGWDHLDLNAMESAGIELISLRGHTDFLNSIPSTAEHTWALICALMRRIPAASADVRQGKWDRDKFRGYELKNKKIGIVGLGRVGKKIAKYAQAFEMRIGYFDPFVSNKGYQRYKSINDLLAKSDIISLHVHLTEETRHLLHLHNLSKIKRGCFIINTSRGKIWDENALVQVFNTGRIKGIATDVLADELDGIYKSALWKLQNANHNVIITPHLGGATYEAMWSCEEYLASYVVERTV